MPIRSGMRLDVPTLSIQLCWYSTMQKNRHYKEAARREEPLQMRRQKKITVIIAIQMSSCFANKY